MSQWIAGIGSSLIATVIVAVVATLSPAELWQRYWPVAAALGTGVVWFSGWWLLTRWRALERRLDDVERRTGDSSIESAAHRAFAGMRSQLLNVEQKVARLEEVVPKSHVRVCSYCGHKIEDGRDEWAQVPGSEGDSNVAHARCIARIWAQNR